MKKIILSLFLIGIFVACDNNYQRNNGRVVINQTSTDAYVTPEVTNLGDNLDLQALGELVKTAKSAQDLENQLNSSGSINNLDLDGDGKVDYIEVTEYGDGNTKGFSFVVEMPGGEKQEIATVELQKNTNNQVAMNINGNSTVYGNGSYYSSNYSLSDLIIMSYLFSPHSIYHSPYHYGSYPSYYHSYAYTPYNSYSSRVKTYTKTSKITKTTTVRSSSVKSPNSNYGSNTVQKKRNNYIANPTSSQKSFSVRTDNSKPNTSGFGNKSGASKSSYSGSSSSYGSSKSSFGSSKKSNSSSGFGSSSNRNSGSSGFGSSSKKSSGGFGSSSRSSRRR